VANGAQLTSGRKPPGFSGPTVRGAVSEGGARGLVADMRPPKGATGHIIVHADSQRLGLPVAAKLVQ
jgi:hypothetical protein